ncbi:SRPBCC family protein [Nannocystis radixulma]|uniref:SRPBCC family protein n=1 Tax=Nannocystis radixulma TaxID=2995305 RepID=A0ABT5BDP8_9BACT|nr:SRPBCC family protein [Nannocystis radixulma]MDC0672272.1 SRPBCC family protein [Nannocystis radixulma]
MIRTDPLSSQWGAVGTRRRVVFRDGDTALEQIDHLEAGSQFRYVVWNSTNDGRRAVRYAVGEFRVSPTATGAHLVWTYRFRGRGWPTDRFLRRFVERDYRPFMRAAMERMRLEATRDLGRAADALSSSAGPG